MMPRIMPISIAVIVSSTVIATPRRMSGLKRYFPTTAH
jgi:hypothetical protein